MLRFGVCRREQFSARPGVVHRLLHGHRVSYRLLRTSTPATEVEVAVFDDIVYHLRLADGIYATTVQGRFQGFDAWLTAQLAGIFDRTRSLVVEDWGTSNSATSADWFPLLQESFPHVRLIASDRTRHLVEAEVAGDGVYVLDADGRPLQYVAPPFVVRFPEPAWLLVNRWIAAGAGKRLSRLARAAGIDLAHLRFDGSDQELHRPPFLIRRLSLVHPRAAELSRTHPAFEIAEHSVFDVSNRGPDVIRTMNVLNRDFFCDRRLADAAAAVWKSLADGGVWVVGRTISESPRIHHASVMRKVPGGFAVLTRHVAQSEVEDIATAFAPGDR